MARKAIVLGWLIAALLGVIPPAWAAETKPQPSALAGVTALDKPVTYTETKIPLGELVQKVATDTGAPLTASSEVADEPVAVVVKDLQARQLLDQLADLLDYRWRCEGKESRRHYEIYQDVAARQREEALRQAELAKVEKRLQQELALHVELARLPEEQFQRLVDEAVKEREAELMLPQEQRLARSAAQQARARRLEVARRLWTPANRALARFLGGLSPEQWRTLREEGRLVFATMPEASERPLPAPVETALRASPFSLDPPGTAPSPVSPGQEALAQQAEDASKALWSGASGYRVTVRLQADRFRQQGAVSLRATAVPSPDVLSVGAPQRFGFTQGAGTDVNLTASPEDSPQPAERSAEYAPERQSRLGKDPVLGVKKRFTSTVKPKPRRTGGTFPLQFRDLLSDLARTYNVQFLSDAYWGSSPRVYDLPSTDHVALFTLLDRLTGRIHRWDARGKLIRLRSRSWFFDRPREVPLRFARRWQAISDENRALTLEEYAEMVSDLTDDQLDSLPDVVNEVDVLPMVLEWANVFRMRHALRLYASFPPVQRQALWRGEPVAAARLLPSQGDLFLAAIKEPIGDSDPPELTHWREGSFSLTTMRPSMGQGGPGGLIPPPGAPPRPVGPRSLIQVGFNLRYLPDPQMINVRYIRVSDQGTVGPIHGARQ